MSASPVAMTDRRKVSLLIRAPFRGLLLFCCVHLASVNAESGPDAAAIASAHPLATAAGFEILDAGGNAFDAAVAVGATLAVVEPYGSGLGGGGFWLLHRQRDGHQVMLDGRERAPLAAGRDLYLDPNGNPVPGASVDGVLAAAIPGTPAALVRLAEGYGRLPLGTSLAPAIRLARDGFLVDEHYRRMVGFRLEALKASPDAARIFLHQGAVPPPGHVVRQPELADLMTRFAEAGEAGFYQGLTADRLVAGVRAAGGIWQSRDLRDYQVIEREPVIWEFDDYRFISAALPSSGGIVLAQIFGMLEQLPWQGADAVQRVHLLIEAMRRSYRDRARYLGDPDMFPVPRAQLLSDEHAAELAASIALDLATPSADLSAVPAGEGGGKDTTHYSILDTEGNRVAATLSINYPFGSGFVVPGTGLLLNDEMDDFSIKPGVPNVYGLVGGEANAIAPGKRMLSSMTPTFIEGPDRIAILGTPGGSRIITMVLGGALEFMAGRAPADWVARPRIHHQYLPDVVQIEVGALSETELKTLAAMGHQIRVVERGFGNMQAIGWNLDTGEVAAASDPRGGGEARVGTPQSRDR